jgi:hypothetical protein
MCKSGHFDALQGKSGHFAALKGTVNSGPWLPW